MSCIEEFIKEIQKTKPEQVDVFKDFIKILEAFEGKEYKYVQPKGVINH